MPHHTLMTGKIYAGTYTNTILLTNTVGQNPATLTGAISVSGTNASSDSGFYSNVNFAWSLSNLGRITATGATSYGICLLHGGTIQNGAVGNAAGLIQSDETGILITGAAASVVNDGSITGILGRGVFLQDGGTLVNGGTGAAAATIRGGFVGVAIYNPAGSLTNAGTILDTGSAGLGVELYSGTVANLAGGRIAGIYGVGLVARAATGTLTNAGTIIGYGRDGVELTDGGSVTNSGSIAGAIGGVLALYGATSVSNTGAISGGYAGVDLLAGGTVTNHAGAHISGGFGVSFGNGTVATAVGTLSNDGMISGSAHEGVSLGAGGSVNNTGSIYGAAAGVAAFYGRASVINTGSIGSGFIGVKLGTGGTITNASGATINGAYGIVLANGVANGTPAVNSTLSNAGSIGGSGQFGVELLTNGSFVNQAGGTISGGRYGVYIRSVTGTISNYGVITGQVGIYSRPVVANNIRYTAAVTINNAGTIIGTNGAAVSLFSSNDLLIDHPGAVFVGGCASGGARLELTTGGTGAIGTLAPAITGFATVTEDAGATWTMAGTIAATSTLIALGTLDVTAGATFTNRGVFTSADAATGTIALSHNGTFANLGVLDADMQVYFADPSGHLSLTNALGDGALTTGFSAGDTIYLPNIALSGLSKVYTPGAGGGTLTLTQAGSTVANLLFAGQYSTASFALAGDRNGGTDILIPCFVAGTRIATEAGERRVERLRVGERVLTGGGALRPIVWIGHRAVSIAGHAEPDAVQPVRIMRDAFGAGRPHRDLLLSPDHAVLHQGGLIPVHLLINACSIRREQVASARYYHVELASHDVLLAEGLAVESYLDTGNRRLLGFAGAGVPACTAARCCAPMVLGGTGLARARRHLLVQERGHGSAAAASVELRVAGAVVPPVRRHGRRLLYLLPAEAESVTLHAGAASVLAGAIVDGRPLDLGGGCCASGFAAPHLQGRRMLRALCGSAGLRLPPGAASGPRSLELLVQAAQPIAA